MILVSISEKNTSQKNYSTVENLTQLYRGLSANLDLQKFITMSNFNLFTCSFPFDYDELIINNGLDTRFYEPCVTNLADSMYEFMQDNLDVYYDVVRQIDEYRSKVKKYQLDN